MIGRALFRNALLVGMAAASCTGGIQLRPDGSPGPEKCPDKALEVMRYFRLHVGDCVLVTVDANQKSTSPIRVYDGTVESHLEDSMGNLGPVTSLFGQVLTTGPNVVIRYHWAQEYGEEKIPICAVARVGHGQMRKLPGSMPGMAVLESSTALACIVDEFL